MTPDGHLGPQPWSYRAKLYQRVLLLVYSLLPLALAVVVLYAWLGHPTCATAACPEAGNSSLSPALAIPEALMFLAFFAAIASGFWISVVSDGKKLVITRMLWRRHDVGLDDIKEVTSGKWGPTFTLTDGTVRRSAVPQGDVNYGFGKGAKRRAQSFIDRVMSDVELARQGEPTQPSHPAS